MITSDFYAILDKHPLVLKHFQGVYASNTLKPLKVNKFCIVNNQPIESIGEHWYTLYRDSNLTLECFDSLGIDSHKRLLLQERFQKSRIKEINFNTAAVQKSNTSSCGKFCLYFIFNRLLNQDLDYTLLLNEIFSHDLDDNESKVENYFKDIILSD